MLQPCEGLKVAVDCVLVIYLNWIIPQGSSLVCEVSDPAFDDCTIGLLHNAEILWLKECIYFCALMVIEMERSLDSLQSSWFFLPVCTL